MTDQRPILTVTVNPALDVYALVPRLVPQVKLRCSAPRIDPGGGGVNVSRVIKELGGASTAFLALGGATGTQLLALLAAVGVETHVYAVDGETRTSFTIMEVETGQHYRFVLPGPMQQGDPSALNTAITELMQEGGVVVLTGSLLPGLPDDLYGELIRRARELGAVTILDAHGAALRAAVSSRPDILRLNHIEAAELLGGAPAGGLDQLGRSLLERGLAGTVVVSQGGDGTVVASEAGSYWIRPPRTTVRSSVGAGDSFVGALALSLARGEPMLEAAKFGVAAACSAVLAEGTGLCERKKTEQLVRLTTVDSLAPAASLTQP